MFLFIHVLIKLEVFDWWMYFIFEYSHIWHHCQNLRKCNFVTSIWRLSAHNVLVGPLRVKWMRVTWYGQLALIRQREFWSKGPFSLVLSLRVQTSLCMCNFGSLRLDFDMLSSNAQVNETLDIVVWASSTPKSMGLLARIKDVLYAMN